METSVKTAEVLVPPQPDAPPSSLGAEGDAAAAPPAAHGSSFFKPMDEFSRRLDDIISTHGSAASVEQSLLEAEKKEATEDVAVAMETEASLVLQSLSRLSSPQDKLQELVRKYAELAALRRGDERKLRVLQQLRAENRGSVAARGKLESLCRELQQHYDLLREETLLRCKEDEEKRTEMAGHFQTKLTEIQTQIEQHSARNDKLCRENTNLTEKLESLMNQCELREESLEKINNRRDLQQKLTEAKLQQADALLTEAVEKHKREKEYLLREAIDKTKKCFAMKEQELAMKKKLTLYAQKFDEFQETLAKSNQIYARFKKEMDNMSEKMKKMDKESNLWKTRFENCNKALTDMIEERAEKGKEYEIFVLKIQKLEKLCRALQDERAILYSKIKEVRQTNSSIPSRVLGSVNVEVLPDADSADKSALLTPVELQEIQEEDLVLTENMSRLKEEQARLQDFAAALLDAPSDDDNDEKDNDELEPEEDMVASAFVQFQTKPQIKENAVSMPEQVVEVKHEAAEPVLPLPEKTEDVPETVVSLPEAQTPVENTSEMMITKAEEVQTQVEDIKVQPVESAEKEKIQQQPSEPEKVQTSPPADLKPEAAEAEVLVEAKQLHPVEEKKVQTEAAQVREEAHAPQNSSNGNTLKKQTPKKKKKRTGKNAG